MAEKVFLQRAHLGVFVWGGGQNGCVGRLFEGARYLICTDPLSVGFLPLICRGKKTPQHLESDLNMRSPVINPGKRFGFGSDRAQVGSPHKVMSLQAPDRVLNWGLAQWAQPNLNSLGLENVDA